MTQLDNIFLERHLLPFLKIIMEDIVKGKPPYLTDFIIKGKLEDVDKASFERYYFTSPHEHSTIIPFRKTSEVQQRKMFLESLENFMTFVGSDAGKRRQLVLPTIKKEGEEPTWDFQPRYMLLKMAYAVRGGMEKIMIREIIKAREGNKEISSEWAKQDLKLNEKGLLSLIKPEQSEEFNSYVAENEVKEGEKVVELIPNEAEIDSESFFAWDKKEETEKDSDNFFSFEGEEKKSSTEDLRFNFRRRKQEHVASVIEKAGIAKNNIKHENDGSVSFKSDEQNVKVSLDSNDIDIINFQFDDAPSFGLSEEEIFNLAKKEAGSDVDGTRTEVVPEAKVATGVMQNSVVDGATPSLRVDVQPSVRNDEMNFRTDQTNGNTFLIPSATVSHEGESRSSYQKVVSGKANVAHGFNVMAAKRKVREEREEKAKSKKPQTIAITNTAPQRVGSQRQEPPEKNGFIDKLKKNAGVSIGVGSILSGTALAIFGG